MFDKVKLFREFAAVAGVSGAEQKTAALVKELAAPYVDEIRTDAMGNVICRKVGSGKKLLFAAHMDAVGFYVRGYDEKGNVYVGFTGGVNKLSFWNRMLRFENGARGVVRPIEEKKPYDKSASSIREDCIFVETGAESYEEAAKLVSIGESAVWEEETRRCGNGCIMTPYADDVAGCIVLLDMMEQLRACENEIYYVFTVCEEIGSFGAKTAAFGIECDYAVAVDVSPATDALNGDNKFEPMALGKGPALSLRESGYVANRGMYQRMKELCLENGIAYQNKTSHGGTDASQFSVSKAGIPSFSVGIPHRYIHTPSEIICEKDMDDVCRLLTAFARSVR